VLNKLPQPSLKDMHYDEKIYATVGMFVSVKPVKKPDTINVITRKVFNNYFFKVTPNPVHVDGVIILTVSKAGKYKVELFDNNGKVIYVQEANITTKGGSTKLQAPAMSANGVYYIRLTDTETGKEYVDKIVVS